MEKVQWIVEGMTCSNCALTVNNYLQKQGLQQVKVNPITGEVSFQINDAEKKSSLIKGIGSLGYQVVQTGGEAPAHDKRIFKNNKQRLLFCLVFTIPLMLHMFDRWIHFHWLMTRLFTGPMPAGVYCWTGYFAKSAIQSIRNGLPI